MTIGAKTLASLYRREKITLEGLLKAVSDGVIIEAEFEEIVTTV